MKNLYHQKVAFLLLLLSAFFVQAQKIKVACIGNSVTYGYGLKDPATESYPSVLQKMLGDKYQVGNFGHSGATLLSKGHRPYIKTEEYKKAIDFKGDIAIIHLGLNDTDPRNFPNYRDEFIPDYTKLIETLRGINPKMKIFICKMTPVFTGHSRFVSSTFPWYHDLQKRIEQVAKINNVELIDFYENFHNRPDLITDEPTLHPNKDGAKKLAEVVYPYISKDFGGLKLPNYFTDNMVIQRDKPIRIFGTANAFTPVEVQFGRQKLKTTTGYNGKWEVQFPASSANAIPQTIIVKNGKTIQKINNVLIGDVWLASGQSNMYFSVAETNGGEEFAKKNTSGLIRLLKYRAAADTDNKAWDSIALKKANELEFFTGEWKTNSPENAKGFSGVGYAFATKVQQETGVPIGVIEVAVGGSTQISWVSRLALEQDPLFVQAFKNWRRSDFIMGWARERANTNLKNAKSAFQRHTYEPSYNYEAGIEKLTKFPIKGLIWYQGESDAENAELYQKLFPIFVKDWRNQWKEQFPVYYVQLSSIERPSWNYFRDLQRQFISQIPNVGMVVSSDLGHKTDVHPKDKIPVGLRLANLALNETYHKKDIVPYGPMVKSVTKQNEQIVVEFNYNKGLKTSDNQPLRSFKVLTNKGLFVEVKADIINDRVILEIPKGEVVEKVVYAWEPFSMGNLINEERLPASTFMMDLK